ncbi:MAG: LysE family transporter, partial [Polaromonas sp.]|nr:LysE family transporter [Polaromonas sp.]
MDIHTWTAYFFAATLIAISPGSGAILAMSHGLNYGVRRTHATIAGLQAGLLVILLVAGAGVGSLLVASELAFGIIKTLGAAYLIYLGWSQWRSTGTLVPKAGASAGGAMLPPGRRWLSGFLTNVTNP